MRAPQRRPRCVPCKPFCFVAFGIKSTFPLGRLSQATCESGPGLSRQLRGHHTCPSVVSQQAAKRWSSELGRHREGVWNPWGQTPAICAGGPIGPGARRRKSRTLRLFLFLAWNPFLSVVGCWGRWREPRQRDRCAASGHAGRFSGQGGSVTDGERRSRAKPVSITKLSVADVTKKDVFSPNFQALRTARVPMTTLGRNVPDTCFECVSREK